MATKQPGENTKLKVERRKRVKVIKRKESSDGKKENNAKYKIRKNGKLNTWRPTKKTPELMEKLKYAFSINCTNEEACAYAGIHPDTFYDRINNDKDFSDKIKMFKQQYLIDVRGVSKKRAMDEMNNDSTKIIFKLDKRYSDKAEIDVGESSLVALAKLAEEDRLKREKWEKKEK